MVGHATTKSWKSSIWVFPQFWNSSAFQILQLCKIFTVPFICFHWLYIYEFMSSTAFTYSYFFKLLFLLSECDRTLPLYAILNQIYSQILHVRSIWNSFKVFTVSLAAEEIANETLKQILSKFSVFATVPHPMMHYFIHPRTYTISTTQYMGDTCRVKEKGQGHVRPKSSGDSFSPCL